MMAEQIANEVEEETGNFICDRDNYEWRHVKEKLKNIF
jgi:hypothetical protein